LGTIASPLTTVRRRDGDLAEIGALAASRGVDRLIIGLPTGMTGREGPQAALVRAFAEALALQLGPAIRVEFWDERLTTAMAERSLRARGGRRGRDKGEVDAVAAAVILQGYLDAQRARRLQRHNPDSHHAE
jgi:putative Holliday junction resolvase